MNSEKYINEILRPRIQADGGEIQFVSEQDNTVTVLFQGECSKCLILNRCVSWIESEMENTFGKEIKLIVTKKKPFFWDVG